jgi:hypothetical protein
MKRRRVGRVFWRYEVKKIPLHFVVKQIKINTGNNYQNEILQILEK